MEKYFTGDLAVMEHPLTNTRLIFMSEIHSWINTKIKEFIHSIFKKFKDNILLVKKITKFNDNFFRIKVCTPNFCHEKFEKVFEKAISGA